MIFFKRREFACKCGCGFDTVDYELADVLDMLRSHYKTPIIITSGCRCTKHNKEIGGATHSKHIIGQASDFKVVGVNPVDVYKYLDKLYPDKYGIGLYSNRIHLDIRYEKARWDKS